jgi:hypothetical protein
LKRILRVLINKIIVIQVSYDFGIKIALDYI